MVSLSSIMSNFPAGVRWSTRLAPCNFREHQQRALWAQAASGGTEALPSSGLRSCRIGQRRGLGRSQGKYSFSGKGPGLCGGRRSLEKAVDRWRVPAPSGLSHALSALTPLGAWGAGGVPARRRVRSAHRRPPRPQAAPELRVPRVRPLLVW